MSKPRLCDVWSSLDLPRWDNRKLVYLTQRLIFFNDVKGHGNHTLDLNSGFLR